MTPELHGWYRSGVTDPGYRKSAIPARRIAWQTERTRRSARPFERHGLLPIGNGNGPYQLTPAYKANVMAVDSRLAAVAGARLAVILNQAFPE